MEILFSGAQSFVSFAVPMIILLGLLIFVHELGHFLVAKYFKVRVETFSLGFGPKILKHKRGDTVYAISAIPLGGYVKMFGDDPTAEVQGDQKAYAFTAKPVGQRIAIVLAGPLMNFFFAILLFSAVSGIGEMAFAPKLGDIDPKTPAYASGFRSGDTIVKAGDQSVRTWDDFQQAIGAHGDKTFAVEVQRAGGATETLQVTPKTGPNKNVMSWERYVGDIEGLTPSSRATFVGVTDPKSVAATAGIQSGDEIKSINGTEVTKWRELVDVISAQSGAGSLKVAIERGALSEKTADELEKKEVTLTLPANAGSMKGEELLSALGIEFPELFLAGVEPKSPAAEAGLKPGDRLISIDSQPVQSFEQVAGIIRSFGDRQPVTTEGGGEQKQQPLNVVIKRDGQEQNVAIIPNIKSRMSPQGKEERRFEIGIRPMIIDAMPATVIMAASNPAEAVVRGFNQTIKWTNMTVLSFVRLFQREVSPKNIGGIFSIGQMAQKSWQHGPSQFLIMMAIISINLFLLNLFPIPVLDGGHLVFYTIEAIKGAPLSMRKMEIAQQVGLVLLLFLMGFALFNDMTRMLN